MDNAMPIYGKLCFMPVPKSQPDCGGKLVLSIEAMDSNFTQHFKYSRVKNLLYASQIFSQNI